MWTKLDKPHEAVLLRDETVQPFATFTDGHGFLHAIHDDGDVALLQQKMDGEYQSSVWVPLAVSEAIWGPAKPASLGPQQPPRTIREASDALCVDLQKLNDAINAMPTKQSTREYDDELQDDIKGALARANELLQVTTPVLRGELQNDIVFICNTLEFTQKHLRRKE